MGLSLILLASGLLLLLTGVILLAIRKQRKIAVACLILGVVLLVEPPRAYHL